MDYHIFMFVNLLIGPLSASESPFSPRKLWCMFFAHANVTCYWEPSVNAHSDTHYTLQVNLTGWSTDQCHSVQTHCSVPVESLNRPYCIQVLAHSHFHSTAGSETLCLDAINAAKLPAPPADGLRLSSEREQPKCLKLHWSTPKNFPLTDKKVQNGCLIYELQYSTPNQPASHTLDVDLRKEACLCVFSPCTEYRVRIRYRYKHALSHWSDWSSSVTQHTEAEAPTSTPQLWRTIQAADVAGFRHVTLLWKMALQMQASCTALWFTVLCELNNSSAVADMGDCHDLGPDNSSCHLTIPSPQTCTCTLSMSNTAGSSPSASITIPSQWESEQRCVVEVQVKPLGDFGLEIEWTALKSMALTSFIIEWCVTLDGTKCQSETWWQRVGQNTHTTIITEGVEPNMCYTVSVRAAYGIRVGPGLSVLAYSRQAAPSAGPKLHVAELGCSYVLLCWSPVPLYLRNGFITQYTLHYQSVDNFTRELHLSADFLQYSFRGVAGPYRMYLRAHTQVGRGPAGPVLSVFIEPCTSLLIIILSCVLLTVGLTCLLCICWMMRQRLKKNMWPKVPNPAHSSISKWL